MKTEMKEAVYSQGILVSEDQPKRLILLTEPENESWILKKGAKSSFWNTKCAYFILYK